MAGLNNYKVVGTQPIRKPGTKAYAEPGETFAAKAEDVKFLVDIGAVAETKAAVKTAKRSKK